MNPLRNLPSMKKTLMHNLPFYLAGILIVLGIKYFYSHAAAQDLLWILAPTTRLVTLLTGISFSYVPEAGYANHSLRILIAPSCSGIRFLTILFAALFFSFVHRLGKSQARRPSGSLWIPVAKSGYLAACLLLAYGFTLLTNSLRILLSLCLPPYLEQAGILDGSLTPDRLHTLIGVFCYFLSLFTLYRLADIAFRKMGDTPAQTAASTMPVRLYPKKALAQLARACLLPLFWYLMLTLGIPLLGRAYVQDPRAFAEYALLLLIGCTMILLPCFAAALISRSCLRKKEN